MTMKHVTLDQAAAKILLGLLMATYRKGTASNKRKNGMARKHGTTDKAATHILLGLVMVTYRKGTAYNNQKMNG